MSIVERLNTWIPQVQGQYINMDWNPQNKGFGAQCWDTAAHWSNFLGLPIINTGNTSAKSGRWPGWAGNMVDCFPQTPAIAAAYTLHGPNTTGQPGDIVVWDDSYWYYPATHVAVLYADKNHQLQCISQNSTPSRADNPYPEWTSGPTTIQSLPRQGLLGFIRPWLGGVSLASSGITTPTTSEEDEMSAEDIKYLKEKAHRSEELLLSLQAAITDPITGYIGRAAMETLAEGNPNLFIKGPGDENPTIYAYNLTTGDLRGLVYEEWAVSSDAGAKVAVVDLDRLNKLLAYNAAKEALKAVK